jgi:anti-sigma factor RsiW
MTDCPTSERLWAYLLGACEGPERDVLDAHVLDCRACLVEYFNLKRVNEDGAAFDERPRPAVRARLRDAVRRRGPRRMWLVVGAAAAAAVVFLLGSRVMLTPQPLPPPPGTLGSGLYDALPFDERT